MALARIRSTNHEFRNATLTGAQIRVRSGLEMRIPVRSGQRLFQSVMRDQDQLYGNQTAQGLVQDMMLADLIARQRMMPDPATGIPADG